MGPRSEPSAVLHVAFALCVVAIPRAAATENDCPPEASAAAREKARLLLKSGQERLAAGHSSQGEDDLRAAEKLDPASPFPSYALGLALMDGQRFPVHALEQRLGDLARLRQRPDREPAGLALALGNAQFHAGNLEEAEREFRRALATEPRSGDAHNNLAVVLMLQGKLDEAEREIAAAEKTGLQVAPRLKDEIRKRRAAAPP